MGCITDNKYLQFYIENYDNILALNEIIGHSEAKLPQVVVDEIKDIILEMKSGYFDQNNLKFDSDDRYIWWYDSKLFKPDPDCGQGVYFIIDFEQLLKLISSPRKDITFISVAFETGEISKVKDKDEFIQSWLEHLREKSSDFKTSEITISEHDQDHYWDYLVNYLPRSLFEINALANKDEFRQNVQTAVQTFTDTLLPVLRDYPEESKKKKR
jgi:hypothetical protein